MVVKSPQTLIVETMPFLVEIIILKKKNAGVSISIALCRYFYVVMRRGDRGR